MTACRAERPTTSPRKSSLIVRSVSSSRKSKISFSVTITSSRISCGSRGMVSTSCSAKAIPTRGGRSPRARMRGDGAVVVALAVAEARAAPVEPDHRHDDEVGMNDRRRLDRHHRAEAAGDERVARREAAEDAASGPRTITGRPITAPRRWSVSTIGPGRPRSASRHRPRPDAATAPRGAARRAPRLPPRRGRGSADRWRRAARAPDP